MRDRGKCVFFEETGKKTTKLLYFHASLLLFIIARWRAYTKPCIVFFGTFISGGNYVLE
jgi:hypothetical protein